MIGEKVGSAGFGRADFGRSADFLGCVPCRGYECHGYDHGPNWEPVRDCAYCGLGDCFPARIGRVR